jgi:8-oxo-dGTP pyrophosphatase MutT (NUDIX family)
VIHAAGILFRDQARRLLLLRRADGSYPEHWALPAGKIEVGETAEQGARRETLEELTYEYCGSLKRLAHHRDDTVDFTTFTARVDHFEPTLNDEHDAFLWVTPREALNLKLHPGVRGLLTSRLAMDAKPKKIEQAPIVLKEIRPNLGVEAAYRRKLLDLLERMRNDLLRRLKTTYHPVAEQIGMDDDPVVTLRRGMRLWRLKWVKRFDRMSEDIAKIFAERNQQNLDVAFRKRLKDAGFTVAFKPTERMTSAYRAVVAENVNLIKSIPQQFLKDVESSVWTNVMKGSDLHTLSKDLREKYGISHRRAAFIATDQNAKARAVFEEARRSELGIEEAEWRHSGAGKYKRPTHIAMDRKRYKIKEGMWDPAVQKYIWPGTEPRCRCTSRSILPKQ